MNSKIKNYVDVLFKGIPNTQKAKELKEEILSNLNEHFEAHIKEGKSENQAYTESLADLGDVDELLKNLEPEKELKSKIDLYKTKRAKYTSISIILYIIGVTILIGLPGIAEIFNLGDEDKFGIVGLIIMFIFVAIATGLLVYTHMSIPQDVSQYIHKTHTLRYEYNGNSKTKRFIAAFLKLYWALVLAIYLIVSFSTGRWAITWLIWIIASAIKNAVLLFLNTNEEELKEFDN